MYGSQETHKTGNDATHSPTGTNTGSAYDYSTRPPMQNDGASALSMKSGVLGSSDQKTEERALRSDGITGQSSPIHSQNTSSGLGHNPALSGAGAAAAGAGGAYAAARSGNNDNIVDPTHTDRSFPLSGGAVVPPSSNTTTSPAHTDGAADLTSTSSTSNRPPMTSMNTGTAGGTNAVSGDAARANLGLDRFSAIDHSSHSHSFRGDPCETEPAEKTLAFIPGPHATVAANMLDPHVPGEFPREDGMDPHSSQGGLSAPIPSEPLAATRLPEPSHDHSRNREAAVIDGVGVVGAAEIGDLAAHKKSMPSSSSATASPLGSNPTHPTPLGSHGALPDRTVPTQQPVSSSTNLENEHHHGRNAALVGGGATAAGLGAYAATRDHEQQPLGSSAINSVAPQSGAYQPIAQSSSPQHVPGNPLTGKLDAQPQTAGYQTTQQPPLGQEKEHHYGRNAALAGGATAATGAAGYAALESGRGDTGPASKTIGPHDSNLANIVDPRVRPEPEKMKDHTTSGPWQSDTLNKLDPKVESDPYKAEVKAHGYATREPTLPVQLQQNQQQQVPLEQNKDHHYGRDAALVGGTGAAAYGASQLHDRREQDPLTQTQQQQVPLEQNKDHHYGRDAALVGGTGTAAYGASQLHDRRQQDPLVQSQQQQQVPLEQNKEHHYGRDAALVGGTGAAAYGASEVYDKHEQEKLLKEQEKQAKHDAKEHDKELKHEAKEHDKQAKKEEERIAKENEKAAKEHAKEQEKLEKHHAKEAEKAEEKRQKELEKLEKEKEKENQKLAAARADEAEAKHKEHNKLHKDPPEEREKKDGIFHRIFHHKQYERERPEGRGASFDDERPKGLEYKDADEERFARQHEQLAAKRSLDGPGHAGLPAIGTAGGVGSTANDGIVTEPHTGLPMNVGKYGSGAGGTDGGEHIAGYGEHVAGYHAT